LEEYVLPDWNQEAGRLNTMIRGGKVQTYGVFDRRWVVGRNGAIYHYEQFNPRVNQFARLSMFHVDPATWRLAALTYARDVTLARASGSDGEGDAALTWTAHNGWSRTFKTDAQRGRVRTVVDYEPFADRPISLEPPRFFSTE